MVHDARSRSLGAPSATVAEWILWAHDGIYEVGGEERGEFRSVRCFETEDAACRFMLGRLEARHVQPEDSSARLRAELVTKETNELLEEMFRTGGERSIEPHVNTIPVEFVEWSGFRCAPLNEGERLAVDNQETRFVITGSPGVFHVLRSSRGEEPDATSAFAHEIDALRQLMLILGGDGRSIHSLPRLGVPAEASGAATGILIDQTEPGSVRLSWDEGGERHRGTFHQGALGHMHARKFAQCIGSTLSDLAQALRSPDGGPLFQPAGWTRR